MMNYNEVYKRNIGLFSTEEQNKLKHAKVAIAGVGGVGSYQAVALARMGIGELSILDPGVFDEPDMNRQYGATKSTIGRNKAEATAEMLREINPFMKLNVFTKPASTKDEVLEFISESTLVIDAIDYAGFWHKQIFHETARELGLYILTGPIPGFGATLQVFDPKGMTIEEYYNVSEDRNQWNDFKIPINRTAPPETLPQVIFDFVDGKIDYISTNGASAQLVGGLLGMEVALIITGKRKKEDMIVVPEMVYLDLLQQKYMIYNPITNEIR